MYLMRQFYSDFDPIFIPDLGVVSTKIQTIYLAKLKHFYNFYLES